MTSRESFIPRQGTATVHEQLREGNKAARSLQPPMIRSFMPFKGIRYNTAIVGDIARVVAPPYDVISPEQRDQLSAKHPCNIVHLELGKDQPGDTGRENRYTRAGTAFFKWAGDRCLTEDTAPAFYVYDQQFRLGLRTFTRRAFFAAVRLEPFGSRVLPHEETMPGPRADRLRLITACPVNLSPIFGLYRDPDNSVPELLASALPPAPEFSFEDFDGIKQALWKIDDPQAQARLSELMETKRIYIADGHHRYETALRYRDLAVEAQGKLDSADARNFVMIACVSIADPGLVILPAHRVIGGIAGFEMGRLLEKLAPYFDVAPVNARGRGGIVDTLLGTMAGKQHAFGLYSGGTAHSITLRDEADADANPALHTQAWKRLDVSMLVWLILEHGLGLKHDDLSNPEHVTYVKDAADAAALVDAGQYQVACYLNPTRVDQLEEVAQAGERMPPKSTYFYPKLLTGLVMRRLV